MHRYTLCIVRAACSLDVWMRGCMTVHSAVCIYLPLVTGGNVQEVRSAKPNSKADTHLDAVHTLPLALGQRSSHTTHRPLPPCLSDPLPPLQVSSSPHPASPLPPLLCTLLPLFSHAVSTVFFYYILQGSRTTRGWHLSVEETMTITLQKL